MTRLPLALAGALAGAALGTPAVAGADAADLDAVVADIDAGHAADVIARLRPRLAELDASERCALGLAYAGPDRRGAKPDRARGLIYLASCGGGLPTAIAEHAGTVRDRLVALAERAGDTRVEIVAPDPLPVDIDRLAGDVVIAPATVWLAAGAYKFTAHLADGTLLVSERTLGRRSSANVLFEPPRHRPPPPGPKQVSFDEPDATYVGPPPKQDHPSMLPDRFAKGLRAQRSAERERRLVPPPPWRRPSLGVRFGTGLVDSATGDLVPVTFAALYRVPVTGHLAIEGRFDLMRRGAARMASATPGVWTAGAGGFARWWLIAGESLGVSVVGGVRAEVRHVFDGDTDLGATVAGGLAMDLAHHRFAVEVRGEQGLNELAGARPRSVLIDLGFDL